MFAIVAAVSLVAASSGCESLGKKPSKNSAGDRPGATTTEDSVEAPKVIDNDKSGTPKNFFKANRASGGWSQEAREIEKDFNIQ